MKAAHLCRTPYCRNDHGKRSPICSKCAMRRWRVRNPMKAQFNWLFRSAQKRGIQFLLTLSEFTTWALENNYLARVGREPDSVHCDRRDASKGHSLDNIRILTASINCSKGAWSERKKIYDNKSNGTRGGDVDCPF
jgi:hypothetical protein